MDVFWVLALIATPLLFIYFLHWIKRPNLGHLSRKRGLPILGNVLQVDMQLPHLTFTDWSKDLGHVFVVDLLNQSFVVLNSFEAIYEALVTNGNSFAGRPDASFRMSHSTRGCQDVAFGQQSSRWTYMKHTCQRELKMYGSKVKEFEELTLSVITTLVENLRHYAGQPFDPKDDIYSAVANIMTSLLVNKRYAFNDKEIQLSKKLDELIAKTLTMAGAGIELDIFPWLRYLGNPVFKQLQCLRKCQDQLWKLMKQAVQEDGHQEGLVPVLLQILDDHQNGKSQENFAIDETPLKMACIDTIAGGMITTTNTFYGFLNLMCHYPKVQQRMRNEVAKVVGSKRNVSVDDRNNMPYTQAVLLELLRFSSVLSLSIPHRTLTNTSVCGQPIPKGVQVLTNLWALHHDEDFWDAPFEFKPERFLDEDGSLVSASHENRRHLMPFGGGPRTCMGEVLAMRRLFLMMANIIQVFEIHFGEEKVSCDPREYKTGLAVGQKEYKIRMVAVNDLSA